MRSTSRFVPCHLAALALAALCALALAAPSGARTALEGPSGAPDPGVNLRLADPSSPAAAPDGGVSLRLADASSPVAGPHGGVSLRLADAEHPPVGSPAGAPTASPIDSGSDVSTLALVLSLVGMGAVAAAGAAVLTTRLQRRQHGAV